MRKKAEFYWGLFWQKTILGLGLLSLCVSGLALFSGRLFPARAAEGEALAAEGTGWEEGETAAPRRIPTATEESAEGLLPEAAAPEATDPAQARAEAVTAVEGVLAAADLAALGDVETQRRQLYTVDSRTTLLPGDIDPAAFLAMDMSLDPEAAGPQVLIFHTHSGEGYADSDGSLEQGVYGLGERLKTLLEETYGIACLHCGERFDRVDGQSRITGAYERMEPVIAQILAENPSIRVCIDLHRDGVEPPVRLVTEQNGQTMAQLMLFNGLCRTLQNGQPVPAPGLSNPYLRENLALSFRLQTAGNALYPGLFRRTYLNAYRYSLHLRPLSLLVEVGAQTNTRAEALAAMEPLARLLAGTLGENGKENEG
mgnify:CR=1 FL=1